MTEHEEPDAVVGEMNEPEEAEGAVRERLPHPTAGDANRTWWPERLNLKSDRIAR